MTWPLAVEHAAKYISATEISFVRGFSVLIVGICLASAVVSIVSHP